MKCNDCIHKKKIKGFRQHEYNDLYQDDTFCKAIAKFVLLDMKYITIDECDCYVKDARNEEK